MTQALAPVGPARQNGVLISRLTRRQEVFLILLLAVLVRLWDFTAPYISVHWIKQLQIAPIATNFHQHGYNLLCPETNYSADQPNYIEIEFQLVTWLTALLYNVFGVHEWVGRLVTILFSLGTMILLYQLLRLHLGNRPATWGLLFFAFAPSSWYYARALMSESPMLFFSVALVYFFSRWLGMKAPGEALGPETPTGGPGLFLLTALCGALAFLVKLPTLMLFLPLVSLAYLKWGWSLFRQPALWLLAILAVAPAVAYYYHAKVNIGQHYFTVGVGFGGGMWFSWQDFLRPGNYSLMLSRLLRDHLTAVGLVLLPIGLFVRPTPSRSRFHLFHIWLGAVLLYFVMVSGGNLRQTYYQIHLLLPAAAFIGLGWDRLVQTGAVNRWSNAALAVIFLVLCAWGVQPFFEQYTPILQASQALDQMDPAGRRVIIFPPGFGCLYYFNREGWVGREAMGRSPEQVPPEDLPGPLYVTDRLQRGARWAVYFEESGPGARPDLRNYLRQHYRRAYRGEGFEIFDLEAQLPERHTPSAARPAHSSGAVIM